jgi:hypothetical protein
MGSSDGDAFIYFVSPMLERTSYLKFPDTVHTKKPRVLARLSCLWMAPPGPGRPAKCRRWTNERYRALSEAERASVDTLLEETGIETMLLDE